MQIGPLRFKPVLFTGQLVDRVCKLNNTLLNSPWVKTGNQTHPNLHTSQLRKEEVSRVQAAGGVMQGWASQDRGTWGTMEGAPGNLPRQLDTENWPTCGAAAVG